MNKIKSYLKGTFYNIRMYIRKKCREYIYNYEFNEVLNHKMSEYYEYANRADSNIGLLSPMTVVSKMMEKYFGFDRYLMLRIHGIDVDTQNEEQITVTIRLDRPGLLIGKAGKDINALEEMLGKYFNMKTEIVIGEVRDVNVPSYYF